MADLPLSAAGADDSEESLVQRAQALSEEAWEVIYARCFPQIYRYVYFRTSNRETAEDLASQVFLEALDGIKSYRYTGRPLLAWLYRIAHNLTVDHLRRNAREAHRKLQLVEQEAHRTDGTEGMVERTDVLAALSRLRPEQQQVILLRFVHDLPSRQVADVMRKSESAVKALQVRALRALRREMGAPGDAGGDGA